MTTYNGRMMVRMKIILKILLLVLLLALAYGFFVRGRREGSPKYEFFAVGTVPLEMPKGLYHGSVEELGEVSWKGKKFNGDRTGINLFEGDGKSEEKYAFRFFPAKSLRGDLQVLRIDYDQPGNPLWLRFIVDEIVSVAPEQFIGAVYINLLPGLRFRMGYFRLEKA